MRNRLTKTLAQQIAEAAKHQQKQDSGIIVPGGRTTRNWPLCLTCGREVEATELKDVNPLGCEIWARCHGAEDWYHVSWEARLSGDPLEDDGANWAIKTAMRTAQLFDPYKVLR